MARGANVEAGFQDSLIKEIKERYPGCIVSKQDHPQGFPDLLILYYDKWAILECKKNEKAPHRPNQDFWVTLTNTMSFSRFIYPENRKEVLDELSVFFGRIT